jgi:DNA-binding beta-propeller fold protein YncE
MISMKSSLLAWLSIALVHGAVASASDPSTYHLNDRYKIGGEGTWDYIAIDSVARRLYVSHSSQVEVLDADTGRSIGIIADTPGVHGTAIASDLKRGFTSNGGDASVTIFETQHLKTIKKVTVNRPDFILYDPFSKRVFPMSEKATVLDAKTGDSVGKVNLGGKPEAAVSDGRGSVYVNLADKGAVAVIDVQSLTVTKTYPVDRCLSPHSLAIDTSSHRLFVGCLNASLAVLDANSGEVVAHQLACGGVDAGGVDPEKKLVFLSCAEGVVSVIHQLSPDSYELVDTVKTELWARTMAFDSATKKIFLPTADMETVASPDPNQPPMWRVTPGSFRVLVVSP